ncbi:MAG: glycosyltransferase family 4 protein [Chloroflexi bacterium]|nr:glycosyltransferase family 4 protein [Chloroflexota bacterium]
MKFAYITNNRLPSEKANAFQIAQMCSALASQGADVTLFYPARRNLKKFEGVDLFDYYKLPRNFKLRPLPCADIFHLSGGNAVVEQPIFLLQTFTFALSLIQALRHESFDVYYARDIFVLGAILAAFRQLKKRMFFEAHTFPESKFGREWQRRVIKRLGGVISISSALADQYLGFGISPHNILIAPDAVDLKRYEGLIREDARRRLEIGDQRLAVYTGHLYEWKGASVFAEAASQLENVRALIVGGTEGDVRRLRAEVSERGWKNVEVIGYVAPDQVPLYQVAADVVVLPNSAKSEISRLHTSPLKLFEYMASGTPIVASDLPSLREVLRDHENAILVEADDANALANGIKLLLNDRALADRLAATARKDVETMTWSARAESVIRFCGV